LVSASDGARNAAVGGVADALASGTLEVRDSTTVLATITLPDPCLGSPSGGSSALAGVWSATATGAGTPDNFRLRTSGAADVITGSVGTSGTDLIFDRATIAVGDTVSVTTAQLSQLTGESITGSGDLTLPAAELSGSGAVTTPSAGADYEFDWSEILGESYVNGSGVFTSDPAGATVPNSGGTTLDLQTFTSPVGFMSVVAVAGQDFDHAIRGDWPVDSDRQLGANLTVPAGVHAGEWWIEIPMFFEDGWDVTDHKTVFIFTDNALGGSADRWEMKFGAFTNRLQSKINNGGGAVAAAIEGSGEMDIEDYLPVSDPGTPLIWDGAWHIVRWHIRTGASPLSEVWVDGTQYLSTTNFTSKAEDLERIVIWGNAGPNAARYTMAGDVKVHLTDPGW
jgi:hypothetical protein